MSIYALETLSAIRDFNFKGLDAALDAGDFGQAFEILRSEMIPGAVVDLLEHIVSSELTGGAHG